MVSVLSIVFGSGWGITTGVIVTGVAAGKFFGDFEQEPENNADSTRKVLNELNFIQLGKI